MYFLQKALILTLVIGTFSDGYCQKKRKRDNTTITETIPKLPLELALARQKKIDTLCEKLHDRVLKRCKPTEGAEEDNQGLEEDSQRLIKLLQALSLDDKEEFAKKNARLVALITKECKNQGELLKEINDKTALSDFQFNLTFAEKFLESIESAISPDYEPEEV